MEIILLYLCNLWLLLMILNRRTLHKVLHLFVGPEITTYQPAGQEEQCQKDPAFEMRKEYEFLHGVENICKVLNGTSPLRSQFFTPRRVHKVIVIGKNVTCGITDGFRVLLTPEGTCTNCGATYCFLESQENNGETIVCSYFCKPNHATAAVDLFFLEGKVLCKIDII